MNQKAKYANFAEELRDKVIFILYAALILKFIARFVPALNFFSTIVIAIFFLFELFLLNPLSLVVMSIVVGLMFYILPVIVEFLLGMVVGSFILLIVAVGICYLLSSVIITVVWGVIVSVQVSIFSAPLAFAGGITMATVGLGTLLGAGVKGAADSVAEKNEYRARNLLLSLLLNILVFAVICWPILSYTNTFTGVLACKPAATLSEIHRAQINIGEKKCYNWLFDNNDEEDQVFKSNFYHEYIRGRNNNITQGGKNRIAGNDGFIAVALNDIIYLYDSDLDEHYLTTAYRMKETDAMVMHDNMVFIFGRNKIFVYGMSGYYTWRKTNYTSDFEKLTWEEQCEYIFDILERQNTKEDLRFSYEEVGAVAYAQRNGILLNYNRLTRTALFTRVDKDGQVTVYAQTNRGSRTEQVSFKPNTPEFGQTWVMVGAEGILYQQDGNVIFLNQNNGWSQHYPFTDHNAEEKFRSIHYGWVGEDEDTYIVYIDEDQIFLDIRYIGKNLIVPHPSQGNSQVAGFVGNYFYSIQHKDTLLSRLTFIHDISETNDILKLNSQIFFSERIPLDKEHYLKTY